MNTRARDLGIPFPGATGRFNSITDVPGVEVGHATIVRGEGRLTVGKGPVRTGVTAVLPRGKKFDPVFAGWYALNGNGEMTGTTWIGHSGFLETPVLLTNTFSLGVVRDAALQWMAYNRYFRAISGKDWYAYPVVAETYDGVLNDIQGQHVTPAHVFAALDDASGGPVAEGNVGGGTGMIAHGFKGGIGTSSRRIDGGYTVGVLVQANHGNRDNFTVAGVPVGREIQDLRPEIHAAGAGARGRRKGATGGKPRTSRMRNGRGSIIVIVATDAPLLPHQLTRVTQRVPIGIGLVGGMGENWSGDLFLAFSTANRGVFDRRKNRRAEMLPNDRIDTVFEAVVHSTGEAILNAMVAAVTMTGIDGNRVYGLPHDRLRTIVNGSTA